MASESFDVVVIGSGPGGYVAAIRAAQLDLKTAVVERDQLGGICLNWGCIPTKALLRTAEVFSLIKHAANFGLEASPATYDIEKVVKRSRQVAAQLSAGVKGLLKKNKVTVVEGIARLEKGGGVSVAKDRHVTAISARNIILATGARARELKGFEADGDLIWSYREAMVPKAMPRSLLVIGSGAIGIEFASFYRTLGAEVTVIEMLDRILPVEDEEISALARKTFEKQGVKVFTGTTAEKLERHSGGARVTLKHKDGKTTAIDVERIISAIGIVGNTENLGLEALGVRVEKSHVAINEWCETGVKGVYAIGDLAGPPWLAHKASHEGVLAVERIAGVKGLHPMDVSNIPGCTYSLPQIASVGLTEAAAKAKGRTLKIGRFPFIGNGKAIALGEPQGLVKTIFDANSGELLGAHMIGAEVTELIQGYTIAKTLETTEAELMHTIFPHPTLSEMMHESVLDAYGRVIHI